MPGWVEARHPDDMRDQHQDPRELGDMGPIQRRARGGHVEPAGRQHNFARTLKMRGSISRKFGSGAISRRAAERFSFGTTSEQKTPLRIDDGMGRDIGAIGPTHAVDRKYNGYNRSSGMSQPSDKDFGPRGMGTVDHINRPDRTGPQWNAGSGYTPQPDKRGPTSSTRRAKSSSADEFWQSSWYSAPSRRQGG
jgi:hypothetical protein